MKKILTLFCLCCFNVVFAESLSINIFAVTDKNADKQIAQINQQMNQANLYSKYAIEPFNKSHTVHLTMYLTSYDDSQLVHLERAVSKIAHQMHRFYIDSSGASLKASNYLMLDVKNTPQLQALSDKVVASASTYRDVHAEIPTWAKSYPLKAQLFQDYGSPNVYEEFNPHFSVFAAKIKPNEQKEFESAVNEVLAKNSRNLEPIKVDGLGIGIVDANGQIVKIIKIYSFKK